MNAKNYYHDYYYIEPQDVSDVHKQIVTSVIIHWFKNTVKKDSKYKMRRERALGEIYPK